MNLLFAAAPNPFDVKAALLAGHAQHPVIVHFPIALFIASAVFDVLAIWRKQPLLAVVAYFNLVGAAITVKSGEKITWVNRDEEPHTIVSVEKQFKKSSALDTDQEFTVVAGSPGTYSYFCSVHPKMTGTIIVKQ